MAPLYYLNPPPNPFWDFVAGIDDHPFFRGQPPRARPEFRSQHEAQTGAHQPTPHEEPNMSEKAQGKQPFVEDPPEVDPSTVKPKASGDGERREMPFRGRGRCGGEEGVRREGREGHCRRGGGPRGWGGWAGGPRGGHHGGPPHGGPPPFMAGHPWFGGPQFHHGPPGPHGHHHGPPPEHVRGHCRRQSPPHSRRPGFDLGQFLNHLGERLGIDLAGAAEGLGLERDRFYSSRVNQDADFEPRTDIFENKKQYTIHLSLPGAKKDDVGVDWDGENSVLRIAGVVHRPGADEQMLNELVVDGRKREAGVFEKAVRLGTKNDPASIDVTGITAKMTDGVLVVKVPKVDVVHEKREVPIASSHSPSPHNADGRTTVFDADQDMYDTVADAPVQDLMDHDVVEEKRPEAPRETQSRTLSPAPTPVKAQNKEKEAAQERAAGGATAEEQLPAYEVEEPHGESDWEKYSDEEEGEYVKINVD